MKRTTTFLLLILVATLAQGQFGHRTFRALLARPSLPPVAAPVAQKVMASSFGVSSSNTAAQNNAALINMRDALKGKTKPPYTIVVPDEVVTYSDKTWLHGVYDWKISGSGPNSALLAQNGSYSQLPTVFFPTWQGAYATGIRFKSVAAGSTIIPLLNAADLSKFFVGQRVVLTGKERQFYGWPPNHACFEFKLIKSKGTDAGGQAYVEVERMEVNEPDGIEFSYNENWKDVQIDGGLPNFYTGKPRLFLLDNPDVPAFIYPKKAVWENLRLLPWTGDAQHSVLATVAEVAEYRGISLAGAGGTALNPTENFITRITGCTFDDRIESDKMCWRVEMEGGGGGNGLTSGNGTRYMYTSNFTHTAPTDVSPHYLKITNSSWSYSGAQPAIYGQPEGHTSAKATFKNLTFNCPGNLEGHIDIGGASEVTLNGADVRVVPGEPNNFYVPASGNYGLAKNFSAPHPMRFWKKDGSKFATIIDIIDAGANGFKVLTTGDQLADGETWEFPGYAWIIDSGGHVNNTWGAPVFTGHAMKWKGNLLDNDYQTRTTVWNQEDFKWVFGGSQQMVNIRGTIHQITINVTTPAAVPASISFLKDANSNAWYTNRITTVDLTKTGVKVINGSSLGGSSTGYAKTVCNADGECVQAPLLNGYIRELGCVASIQGRDNAVKPALPLFTVSVVWTPYTNQHPLQ